MGTPHPIEPRLRPRPRMTMSLVKGRALMPHLVVMGKRVQPVADSWHQLPLLLHGRGTAYGVKWKGQRSYLAVHEGNQGEHIPRST
jgi:hypothetical protein